MKILVAMDGTEHSWKTLDMALFLGMPHSAEISVIGIVERKPSVLSTIPFNVIEDYAAAVEKIAIEILEKVRKYGEEKGTKINTILEFGPPADTICQVANKGNYDLLVIGNSGSGKLEEFLLGSVSSKIAHSVKANLLIVK